MQIKRYVASNMSDALQQIKSELGSDAVILSARSIKSGSAVWGPLRKSAVEVTAAVDQPLPSEQTADRPTPAASSPADSTAAATAGRHRRRNAAIETYRRAGAPVRGQQTPPLSSPDGPMFATGARPPLERCLIRHQVKRTHAATILKHVAHNGRDPGEVDHLARALKAAGFSSRPIEAVPGKQKILALAGPPGVGKTTTVAKLAAHYALQSSLSVACLSIDRIRIAGCEQLEVIADIIGVPFAAAGRRSDIKSAVRKLAHCELVLIDTPALHRMQIDNLEYISRLLGKIPTVQTHLLIDATSSEDVQAELVERTAPLDVERVIFTKVDEAPSIGHLINLSIDNGLSVSCLAVGSKISEDLVMSPAEYLAAQLLKSGKDQTVSRDEKTVRPQKFKRIFRVAEEKPTQAYLVANQNSDVFHRPECKWTKMIKEDHLVVFADTFDARQKRYKPCRYCCPQEHTTASDHAAGSFSSAAGYR